METAREAWAGTPPDWVLRLAQECEVTSQARVAKRIGRSAAVISQVIRAKYPGDMEGFQELVRGHLMRAVVDCPALGELPTHECQGWRRRAREFQGNNALRVTMFRACRRCPRNKPKEDRDADL